MKSPSQPRPPGGRRPWRGLVGLLWRQPLWAIPFALFFGTLFGKGLDSYLSAYAISLVFSYVIGLFIWAADVFVAPRVLRREALPGAGGMWLHGLVYAGSSLLGSFAAALIVHSTLLPGFLGSARQVLVVALFALLFTSLVSGIMYAIVFYREAIARARAEQELYLARRIQRSFLLSQFPPMPRLEVHAVNVSSKQVSGDFYDVVPAGDRAFLLAIADVAGKGVPAALLSSMLQASLRTQAFGARSVAEVLRAINALVYRSTAVEQFATFFLARVEEDTLRFAYSNAGHNYPAVFRRRGGVETLERGGTVVGILEQAGYEEATLQLEPGDRVVFYTDGISEATNAGGEMFGEERLHATVHALPATLGARETTERILDAVRSFLDGVEPGDDMTVMVLRVLEPTALEAASGDGAASPGAIAASAAHRAS